ncbi:MAG: D-glycerate dehydrogenase [Pirellulaceae bacterium]
MTRPKVYVARRIPEVGLKILSEAADVQLFSGELPPTRDELLSGVAGCSGILSLLSDRLDGEVFEAAGKQLRVVSNFAVGYNNIDVAEALRRGIAVGNTPDVLTDATADVAVGLLLAAARRFGEAARAVKERAWKTWEPMGWIGLDLRGKTLGIVGMGRIGEAVARRLHGGWGMRVLYTARSTKQSVEAELSARRCELDELLQHSDFVSLHVPLCAATTNLIGEPQFAHMKSTAVLVNTARGEIVDQSALEIALREGQIFAAGLDVCVPEPLLAESPLRKLDNCFILPHIGSATVVARNAMATRAAQNIVAGLRGDKLPFPVSA